MKGYRAKTERHMRRLYASLSEKDRRRYAAVEAEKFGFGGVQYIADLFGCDPDTVHHGEEDLERLPEDEAAGRVRKKGAAESQLASRNRKSFLQWKP